MAPEKATILLPRDFVDNKDTYNIGKFSAMFELLLCETSGHIRELENCAAHLTLSNAYPAHCRFFRELPTRIIEITVYKLQHDQIYFIQTKTNTKNPSTHVYLLHLLIK